MKKKEFAPGLPSKEKTHKISQKGQTRLVIQEHNASHHHYDMRLQSGDKAHSWVIRSLPGEKPKTLAIRQPTHTAKYMNFEGTIKSGYGAGTVKKVYDEKVHVLSATNDKIKMQTPQGNFTMVKIKDPKDRNWLMIKTSVLEKGMFDQIKEAALIDELEKISAGQYTKVFQQLKGTPKFDISELYPAVTKIRQRIGKLRSFLPSEHIGRKAKLSNLERDLTTSLQEYKSKRQNLMY